MNGWSVFRHYGSELTAFCNPYIRHAACADWPRLRLEDETALRQLFSEAPPDLLIHCGGICDVDKCEAQPEFAELINVHSVDRLLDHLPASTRLVYCSSDHVFGAGGTEHDEATRPTPLTKYGRTRVAAETLIRERRPDALIIRSGLGVGPSIEGKTGHLDWLRYRQRNGLPMTVVSDEIRSAVWADALATRIWRLAHPPTTGTRHITATRSVSRDALAQFLCRRFDIPANVAIESRADRATPHLGDVTLATRYTDELAQKLAAVVS